ncbi:MAG TPA: NAD-dependent epimerase/dehydratase family protein, partial [Labilithrix sp.]|nr:NAD-dependent epimerase/dehydratase family protein [Labilithrix sp.]
ISESRPLAFSSPYGCSKGAADQYVLDFAHTFGLRATVFRMSCIYGPRQLGTEDQGWVAHFLLRALRGEPISIFGDGRQVRDVLYIDDLVDALLIARTRISRLAGRAFNVGGGPARTTSLVELVDEIARLIGRTPRLLFEPWRRADQRWYVSDVSSLQGVTGWCPQTTLNDGVTRLFDWLTRQDFLAATAFGRPRGDGLEAS